MYSHKNYNLSSVTLVSAKQTVNVIFQERSWFLKLLRNDSNEAEIRVPKIYLLSIGYKQESKPPPNYSRHLRTKEKG